MTDTLQRVPADQIIVFPDGSRPILAVSAWVDQQGKRRWAFLVPSPDDPTPPDMMEALNDLVFKLTAPKAEPDERAGCPACAARAKTEAFFEELLASLDGKDSPLRGRLRNTAKTRNPTPSQGRT